MKTFNVLYQCTAYYEIEVEAESAEQAREIFMGGAPANLIGEERQISEDFEGILDIQEDE